jgi:hypothetical protein
MIFDSSIHKRTTARFIHNYPRSKIGNDLMLDAIGAKVSIVVNKKTTQPMTRKIRQTLKLYVTNRL